MSSVMFDNFYRLFELRHPRAAKEVDEVFYEDGSFEIVMRMKNGDLMSYYEPDGTLRRLPNDNITENECRREFGIRMTRMMWSRGMTQTTLSEITGIPQKSISKYMNGKMTPSFYNVERIARALKCSVDELRCFAK